MPETPDPKQVVRRLVTEVMNEGRLELIDELYTPSFAAVARRWLEPFLSPFSDIHMRIVQLVSETARRRVLRVLRHTGPWLGHPRTGRRFADFPEVYFFQVSGERISRAWGVEHNLRRLQQLGLVSRREEIHQLDGGRAWRR